MKATKPIPTWTMASWKKNGMLNRKKTLGGGRNLVSGREHERGGKWRKLFGGNVTTERKRHIMKIELGFWALKLHFSEYYRDQFPFLIKQEKLF